MLCGSEAWSQLYTQGCCSMLPPIPAALPLPCSGRACFAELNWKWELRRLVSRAEAFWSINRGF